MLYMEKTPIQSKRTRAVHPRKRGLAKVSLLSRGAHRLIHQPRAKPWLLRENAEAGVKAKKATKGCFLCELALP